MAENNGAHLLLHVSSYGYLLSVLSNLDSECMGGTCVTSRILACLQQHLLSLENQFSQISAVRREVVSSSPTLACMPIFIFVSMIDLLLSTNYYTS